MVVPSEILPRHHAKSFRDFLLSQCSRVLMLDPQHIWFNTRPSKELCFFCRKEDPVLQALQ